MSGFRDCIVTLIDMIGIRRLLDQGDSAAVATMRRMHSTIPNYAGTFADDTEICFWNDSVLIHSPVQNFDSSFVSAMRPVAALKAAIDAVRPSYAICVKGQSFPPLGIQPTPRNRCRLVYLSASSLAFTNCFDVEVELKTNPCFRKRRYEWYIDNRIIKRIRRTLSRTADSKHRFDLYPKGARRVFHLFESSFIRDNE